MPVIRVALRSQDAPGDNRLTSRTTFAGHMTSEQFAAPLATHQFNVLSHDLAAIPLALGVGGR